MQATVSETDDVPGSSLFWRWTKALLPWCVSAGLIAFVLAGQDLRAVGAAFSSVNLVGFVALTTVFLVGSLAIDSMYLWVSYSWLARAGTYRQMVVARGAFYVLSIVSSVVGMGGIVLYMRQTFGVSIRRGSGVMLNEMLQELGALGLLALLSVAMLQGSESGALEVARGFAVGALAVYVFSFLLSRLFRHGLLRYNPEAVIGVFANQTWWQFAGHLGIKIGLNLWHGLFVFGALACFGVHPPVGASVALTQLAQIARSLPLTMFGVGVDQISFPSLFAGWGGDGGEVLLAFSVAYTFSLLAGRGTLGLLCLRGALRIRNSEGCQ